MKKQLLGALLAGALLSAACGGSGSEDVNPASFEAGADLTCVEQPTNVPAISVLGQQVEGVRNVKACVKALTTAGVVPQVFEHDDCGTPCYTIELLKLTADVELDIELTLKRDSGDQKVTFKPEPVSAGADNNRMCLIGVGGPPNPCAERLVPPRSLTASSAKKAVELSWKAAKYVGDGQVQGYEVWRSTQGPDAGFELVGSTKETKFSDQGLPRRTQFWYYATAVDTKGNRTSSDTISTQTR
jgi:hypothetical protein